MLKKNKCNVKLCKNVELSIKKTVLNINEMVIEFDSVAIYSLSTSLNMSRDIRFPTMWYVRPAKPQISHRIRENSK